MRKMKKEKDEDIKREKCSHFMKKFVKSSKDKVHLTHLSVSHISDDRK